MTPATSTFIVTAELDAASFDQLNALRRQHFPVERNFIEAHLTLFHQVDAKGVTAFAQLLRTEPAERIALHFGGLRKLGRGVAVAVSAPGLQRLRAGFVKALGGQVTRQDAQGFRPHVTVQNKVDPAAAARLYDTLAVDFVPWDGMCAAVQVWEYLGGPWRFVDRLPFTAGDDRA